MILKRKLAASTRAPRWAPPADRGAAARDPRRRLRARPRCRRRRAARRSSSSAWCCTALAFVVFSVADPRGRAEPGARHHLRQPGRRRRARRGDPRRAAGRRRRRGPAADPRGLVAVHRRRSRPASRSEPVRRMSRVLVTGGAGTIGAAVVRRLLRDPDFEVRVSDQREAPAWMREGCEVHRGDLRVLDEARKAMRGCCARHPPGGDRRRDRQLPQAPAHADRGQQRALQRRLPRRAGRGRRALHVRQLEHGVRARDAVPDARGLPPRLPDAALGVRLLASSPARSTAAPRTTSTACRTRSAARSTPTGRARCPTTSPASPTPSRT